MGLLGDLFTIIAPVLICAMVGYGWALSGRAFPTEALSPLITGIGAPCLVFATLVEVNLSPQAFSEMALAAVAACASFAAIAAVTLRLAGLSQRAFLAPMAFPNLGNMGLPLNLLAFGEAGLGLAIVYFAVFTALHFTFGVALVSGSASLKNLARIPVIYAVIAGIGFLYTGVEPPRFIVHTTRLLGDFSIPLMLLTLGVSLARLTVASLRRSVGLAVLRLAVGFAVGLAVVEVFGFEGAARGVTLIQCTMPVAVFNYVFAQRYDAEPEEVAGVVVISTVLSFLSLPALLWFAL